MGVRLPAEYQEVQYIQCGGSQYINTGVNLSSDDFEVFCRFAITQTTGSYEQALFSIWTSAYNYWNCLVKNSLEISVYTSAHHTSNKRVVIGQIYNIAVIRNVDTWSYVFDDEVVTWTYSPTTINDTPLTLCRRADLPNYANSATHARIYDFSVKANGTIVAKYVPCYRKSDNKPGMYDLVSGTFFVNQDTGEDFTVGPDVIDSISPWLVARRRALMGWKPKAYLYNYGQVGAFTGGFDIPQTVWSGYSRNPTIEENYVYFAGANGVNTFLPFKSAIDLTPYRKLVMDVDIESTISRYLASRGHVNEIPNTGEQYELVRTPQSTDPALLGRNKIEIDVSQINQAAYIYFAVGGVTSYKWKLYRAWLE